MQAAIGVSVAATMRSLLGHVQEALNQLSVLGAQAQAQAYGHFSSAAVLPATWRLAQAGHYLPVYIFATSPQNFAPSKLVSQVSCKVTHDMVKLWCCRRTACLDKWSCNSIKELLTLSAAVHE